MSEDFNYIPFPETYDRRKLNSLYREIPLKDTESRLLRKYFNAASNLYGIIPLGKLYEIISSQSRHPVSEGVFRAFAEIAKHECEDYCILGDVDLYTDGRPTDLMDYEVIDVTLVFDDPDDYLSLKQMQHGKPYYVPKRAEFLCYADPFYFEQSKEAAALRDFLVTGMSLEPDKADFLMVDIGYDARCGNLNFQKVMEWFEELGLVFQRDRDVMTFAGVYQAFQNNTRMRCNRGHTPGELHAMRTPEDRVPKSISLGPNIRRAIAEGSMDAEAMRRQIMAMELPSEALRANLLKELTDAMKPGPVKRVKIGRNEPCPCGSGKKYKKCCGR